MEVPLTTDHLAVLSAFRRVKPAAGTRFYDATIDALDELSRSKRDHKALLIVTDGADHYSNRTFRQLLRTARLYGYPIGVIQFAGDDSRTWTESGRQEIAHELEQLTAATGGELFNGGKADEAVDQILKSIHHNYLISFYSTESSSEFSNVEIRIRNRPDLTVFQFAHCRGGL